MFFNWTISSALREFKVKLSFLHNTYTCDEWKELNKVENFSAFSSTVRLFLEAFCFHSDMFESLIVIIYRTRISKTKIPRKVENENFQKEMRAKSLNGENFRGF